MNAKMHARAIPAISPILIAVKSYREKAQALGNYLLLLRADS
jgi:hypothetical protein